MKNLILFSFLLLCCFSCSKSDSLTFEEKILGEWPIKSFVINSCPNTSDNVPMTTSNGDGCIDLGGEMTCTTITFLANEKAEIRSKEENSSPDIQSMTYQINEAENKVSLCQEGEDCIIFYLESDGLFYEMDESGCICIFGFEKS